MIRKTPQIEKDQRASVPIRKSAASDVEDFLNKVAAAPLAVRTGRRGRLIFAMDATMSRQPTWDRAVQLQAEMFDAAASVGGLDVQLAWFRGLGEFRSSHWTGDARSLADAMSGVRCRGGHTQIGRVLSHTLAEARREGAVNALVYVGDCMEEDVDDLCAAGGALGLLGVPVFLFQEGNDLTAATAFREIARLSGGAHCQFDEGSAQQLGQLLGAVAAYAAGGRKALEDYGRRTGGRALLLARQVR